MGEPVMAWVRRAIDRLSGSAPGEAAGDLLDLRATDVDVVPVLLEALRDPAQRNRWALARALGAIGPAASGATDDLRRCVHDADPDLRKCALDALAAVHADDGQTRLAVEACLGDSHTLVAVAAAAAMLAFGFDSRAAEALLVSRARRPNDIVVRSTAASGLISGLKRRLTLLPLVLDLLDGSHGDDVAEEAGQVLSQLDRRVVVPAVLACLNRANDAASQALLIALSRVESTERASDAVIEAFLETGVLRSDAARVRWFATNAASALRLDRADVASEVAVLLDDAEPDPRMGAARAIVEMATATAAARARAEEMLRSCSE
jgi:HEAT repeat protein